MNFDLQPPEGRNEFRDFQAERLDDGSPVVEDNVEPPRHWKSGFIRQTILKQIIIWRLGTFCK